MQLGKTPREEACPTALGAGLRQWADGADLASGNEAHKDTASLCGNDPVQQGLYPAAAPRPGSIPIFQGENVGPEAVDEFVDHAHGFRVICPSGGPESPVDEALWAFQNRKPYAPTEGIDG